MYYVINDSVTQVDESPFETREEAEAWIAENSKRFNQYHLLTQAEMDEVDSTGETQS